MGTFHSDGSDWTKPAVAGFAITAAPGALAHVTRGIYVAGTGELTVTLANGTSVTLTGVAPGVVHPLACTHVTAATATGIVGLY